MRSTKQDQTAFDELWLLSIFLLFGLGLSAMFSASVFPAEREFNDSFHYLKKQLFWGGMGCLGFLFFANLDYRILIRFSFPLALVSAVLLILVFFPGLGKSVSTSYGRNFHRWIQIGGFQIQPSEFSKIAVLLFLSHFYSHFNFQNAFWTRKNLTSISLILLILVLIVLEPAFGTTMEISIVILFYTILIGFPIHKIILLVISAIPLLAVLMTQVGYRKKRLDIWLDPYKYRFDEGHQIVTSFRAFLDGGTFGNPIGSGFSHRYLAYSHTDFVMAAFVEDFGFLGFTAFFVLILFLLIRSLQNLLRVKEKEGFLLGTGIVLLIATQVLINLFVVTGLVPVTGISLPFFSYGGSSLVTVFFLFGILANITRRENLAV